MFTGIQPDKTNCVVESPFTGSTRSGLSQKYLNKQKDLNTWMYLKVLANESMQCQNTNKLLFM